MRNQVKVNKDMYGQANLGKGMEKKRKNCLRCWLTSQIDEIQKKRTNSTQNPKNQISRETYKREGKGCSEPPKRVQKSLKLRSQPLIALLLIFLTTAQNSIQFLELNDSYVPLGDTAIQIRTETSQIDVSDLLKFKFADLPNLQSEAALEVNGTNANTRKALKWSYDPITNARILDDTVYTFLDFQSTETSQRPFTLLRGMLATNMQAETACFFGFLNHNANFDNWNKIVIPDTKNVSCYNLLSAFNPMSSVHYAALVSEPGKLTIFSSPNSSEISSQTFEIGSIFNPDTPSVAMKAYFGGEAGEDADNFETYQNNYFLIFEKFFDPHPPAPSKIGSIEKAGPSKHTTNPTQIVQNDYYVSLVHIGFSQSSKKIYLPDPPNSHSNAKYSSLSCSFIINGLSIDQPTPIICLAESRVGKGSPTFTMLLSDVESDQFKLLYTLDDRPFFGEVVYKVGMAGEPNLTPGLQYSFNVYRLMVGGGMSVCGLISPSVDVVSTENGLFSSGCVFLKNADFGVRENEFVGDFNLIRAPDGSVLAFSAKIVEFGNVSVSEDFGGFDDFEGYGEVSEHYQSHLEPPEGSHRHKKHRKDKNGPSTFRTVFANLTADFEIPLPFNITNTSQSIKETQTNHFICTSNTINGPVPYRVQFTPFSGPVLYYSMSSPGYHFDASLPPSLSQKHRKKAKNWVDSFTWKMTFNDSESSIETEISFELLHGVEDIKFSVANWRNKSVFIDVWAKPQMLSERPFECSGGDIDYYTHSQEDLFEIEVLPFKPIFSEILYHYYIKPLKLGGHTDQEGVREDPDRPFGRQKFGPRDGKFFLKNSKKVQNFHKKKHPKHKDKSRPEIKDSTLDREAFLLSEYRIFTTIIEKIDNFKILRFIEDLNIQAASAKLVHQFKGVLLMKNYNSNEIHLLVYPKRSEAKDDDVISPFAQKRFNSTSFPLFDDNLKILGLTQNELILTNLLDRNGAETPMLAGFEFSSSKCYLKITPKTQKLGNYTITLKAFRKAPEKMRSVKFNISLGNQMSAYDIELNDTNKKVKINNLANFTFGLQDYFKLKGHWFDLNYSLVDGSWPTYTVKTDILVKNISWVKSATFVSRSKYGDPNNSSMFFVADYLGGTGPNSPNSIIRANYEYMIDWLAYRSNFLIHSISTNGYNQVIGIGVSLPDLEDSESKNWYISQKIDFFYSDLKSSEINIISSDEAGGGSGVVVNGQNLPNFKKVMIFEKMNLGGTKNSIYFLGLDMGQELSLYQLQILQTSLDEVRISSLKIQQKVKNFDYICFTLNSHNIYVTFMASENQLKFDVKGFTPQNTPIRRKMVLNASALLEAISDLEFISSVTARYNINGVNLLDLVIDGSDTHFYHLAMEIDSNFGVNSTNLELKFSSIECQKYLKPVPFVESFCDVTSSFVICAVPDVYSYAKKEPTERQFRLHRPKNELEMARNRKIGEKSKKSKRAKIGENPSESGPYGEEDDSQKSNTTDGAMPATNLFVWARIDGVYKGNGYTYRIESLGKVQPSGAFSILSYSSNEIMLLTSDRSPLIYRLNGMTYFSTRNSSKKTEDRALDNFKLLLTPNRWSESIVQLPGRSFLNYKPKFNFRLFWLLLLLTLLVCCLGCCSVCICWCVKKFNQFFGTGRKVRIRRRTWVEEEVDVEVDKEVKETEEKFLTMIESYRN